MIETDAKLLVIDEDLSYIEIVETIIKEYEPNLTVIKAYTGKQAYEAIENNKLDLIISDIYLPDINGYDLCKKVKSNPTLSFIPIIIITALDRDNKLKIKLLEAGAEAFLTKPFGHSELIAHIRSLLRLKSAEDQVRHERDRLQDEIVVKEQYLTEQEGRISLILNYIIEGIWDWDLRTDRIYLSKKFKEMLGYSEDDIVDTNIGDLLNLVCSEDRERFGQEINDYLTQKTPALKSEIRMCYSDGSFRWFLFQGYAITGDDGKHSRLLGIQSDITESKEALYKLEKIALYDYVTELPNRILFYKLAEKEINASLRSKKILGFIFIDLDNFKPINDNYGHQTGDKVLNALSKEFSKSLRPLDIIARFGGDEFMVSVPELKQVEEIQIVINRLRRLLKKPLVIDGIEHFIEFSAGYSIYMQDGETLDDLLKVADERMYKDKEKRKGTNRRIEHGPLKTAE